MGNSYSEAEEPTSPQDQTGTENIIMSSPSAMTQPPQTKEEIIIASNIKDMVKNFLRENVIIWHDPKVYSPENTAYISELKNICDLQVFVDWKEASEYLKKETRLSCCKVITSGTNGELFVKEISFLPFIDSIYVFCENIVYHKQWASQYSKVKCVESSFQSLLDKIRESMVIWQRTSSSLRVDLPSFAPIFDDVDLSEMNNLQYYLQGLINFTSRPQAKQDFLNLARALYGKNKHIEEFDKNYNQYDMKVILNWYTKESFLYKLTNNCLRIAKPDSIQYCRLILKDLETAIKDKYQQESHKFSGLLYRGAYLSDDEWTRLQQNCGREIEMHGFLSTTKQKKVAFNFCLTDLNKKAMISIIVPNFPEKPEQGFAEMSEYTDFPGEDEVLFNVRSRFTVLEASMEEIDGMNMRHLVLLYGAQAMRRYTTLHNPSIEVQISITQATKCNECNQPINIGDGSMMAVNILDNNQYLCKDCIKHSHQTNKLVSLCFSSSAWGLLSSSSEDSKTINLKIEGIVMQYQDSLNVPFYGDQCAICHKTKLNFSYKCVNCKDAKKIYCNDCFNDESRNNCLREGHMMIAQGYSFCFWSDKMSKTEEDHLNFHKGQLEETSHLFQQGEIFSKTHNYEKAIEYYRKYLEEHGDLKTKETAVSYNNLGEAYYSLGEYQKAVEYISKSLEIRKALFGDNHHSTATSYDNLGVSFLHLGEYQKAIEYHSKSLEIKKAVFGDNHPQTAIAYSNLGGAYRHLEEYQKAIEYYSKSLEINKAVFGDNHHSTANSYNNLGLSFFHLGEYQKAIEYYSKSLKIRQVMFGDNHPSTATCYSNLGGAYEDLGEHQKAIEYFSKSLEIRKIVFGDNHPDTATSYNNLGLAHSSLGEYQKATQCHLKSLKIRKVVFGDNHPSTATSYNNLGAACNRLGEYQKAIEYYSQSLEINKAVFGNNHSSTATSFSNLGGAYGYLGEYQKAIEYYSKSLEINKSAFGDNHRDTATSYNNLGLTFYELGQYQKAIEYISKSLEIRKAVFGNNHPSTATSYSNLGAAYEDLGEHKKAIEYYSKALKVHQVVFGNNHPSTGACYSNLGAAYQDVGEYQKAIEYISKSLEIRKVVFGDNHPDTATSYNNLGLVFYHLGEYQKAIEYHLKSLDIRKVVFGDNHPNTATSYNNLGLAYENSGEYKKAIEYYSKSLKIKKAIFGYNHPQTAISYNNVGGVYGRLGEHQKAIEYYSKSLEINKATFGDNHPNTATSFNNLGLTFYELRQYQQAIEYYSKPLEINKAVLGDNHPDTATFYSNLGLAYYQLREYPKAIEYISKSLEIRKAVFGDNHPNTVATYQNLEIVKRKSQTFSQS